MTVRDHALANLLPVDVDEWRTHVRSHAPGGHGVLVGAILADLATAGAATVRLDEAAIRRLVQGAHVHPVGLRRILAKFVGAGLLVNIGPDRAGEWGVYALTMPTGRVRRLSPTAPRAVQPSTHRERFDRLATAV
jgi:hypothetical protein